MSADINSANTQLNYSYQDYEIELFANQTTRISLAFNKVFSPSNLECSLANLDLQVLDFYGNVVYSSSTTNNNVELIEFTPTSYDTYTIRVIQQTPATSSGSAYATPYSIAWIQG